MPVAVGSSGSLGLQGLRVLVAEDNWQVADALKVSLEQIGMVVAGPVAIPSKARILAAEHNPDLAIVDVNLTGEMAYDLMDWLHDRGTPVIVISGYEDLPGSLEKFAAILHKPFTVEALLKAVRRVIGEDRSP
jgi:DNA-binding response OmpR family regulator